MNILLCDEIDSGKSSFCMELVRRLLDAGVRMQGWVTPAHMSGGKKIGHDFVAIEGGRIAAPIPFTRPEAFAGSFPWRRFHFNGEAFEQAAALADRWCTPITGHRSPATDVFIIDEIGPLELEDQKGFHEPLRHILSNDRPSLTVIRRDLERALIERFPSISFHLHSLAERRQLESLLMERGNH